MSEIVLGFTEKQLICGFCEEPFNKKTQGYANYMCSKCHTRIKPQTERAKLVPVVSKEAVEKAIDFIEQTKSKVWKCPEDADEFEDAIAFLRKRLLKKED